jgi:hypothetical protein
MAAANTTSISALYADDTQWVDANPDWAQVLGLVGPAAAINASDAKKTILNMAQRSPVAVAFGPHWQPQPHPGGTYLLHLHEQPSR